MGDIDIEESLRRLDNLTQGEAKMAAAEQLKIAHTVEGIVMGVDERVKEVGGDVQSVSKKVQDVDDRVQGCDDKIQGIGDELDIQAILEPLTPHPVSLHDESGQKQGIADYVRSFVHGDRRMRRWRHDDKDLVIKTLPERADGM